MERINPIKRFSCIILCTFTINGAENAYHWASDHAHHRVYVFANGWPLLCVERWYCWKTVETIFDVHGILKRIP